MTLPIWILTEIRLRMTNRWCRQGCWKPIKRKIPHGTATETRDYDPDLEFFIIWFGTRISLPYHGRNGIRNTISFDITIFNFGFVLDIVFPVSCFPVGWYKDEKKLAAAVAALSVNPPLMRHIDSTDRATVLSKESGVLFAHNVFQLPKVCRVCNFLSKCSHRNPAHCERPGGLQNDRKN